MLSYNHTKLLIEKTKYDFIFFINKNISYNYAINNFNPTYNYDGNSIKSSENYIYLFLYITLIKLGFNIEKFRIQKHISLEK